MSGKFHSLKKKLALAALVVVGVKLVSKHIKGKRRK